MQKNSYKTYLILVLIFFSNASAAIGNAPIRLEDVEAKIDVHDTESVSRGAKFFKTKCLACHSLKFLKHDPVALDAGLKPEAMPSWGPESWDGHPPPDLSLVVPVMGADWVYTFLHSYYVDETKPLGFSNLLWKDTRMPNPFAADEGRKIKLDHYIHEDLSGNLPPYYTVLRLEEPGMMSYNDFDQSLIDLMAFLTHAGEPQKDDREKLGIWVLLFMSLLITLTYAIYRSYWSGIKK